MADMIPNIFVNARSVDVLSILDPMDPPGGMLPVRLDNITVGNDSYGFAISP